MKLSITINVTGDLPGEIPDEAAADILRQAIKNKLDLIMENMQIVVTVRRYA